ncbi:MAG TPA: alpha/beta fold hydrolase [Pyrinomonadaceae bacterium]
MMQKLNSMNRAMLSITLAVISVVVGPLMKGARGAAPFRAAIQQSNAASRTSLAGNWLGVLDVGAAKLRLLLKISVNADNSLRASLDSIDQGASDLRVDSIAQTGSSVRAEMKALGAVFEGKLSADGTELAGTWAQGPSVFPLTFKHGAEVFAPRRPQEPQKPYPYTEEEVVYENRQDKVRLAGTLTIPRGQGPHPALLLITGSGAEDRNETVFGHRPFLVLADYLTRRGVAVLRVDDRGVGGSSSGASAAETSENYVGDVIAGVEFLKTRKEINARQIGLLGHSEGGMIAPLAAIRSKDVAFIILIAGPGVPGDQLLLMQAALILKSNGADDELVGYNRRLQQLMIRIQKEEKSDRAAETRLRTEIPKLIASMPEDKMKALGLTDEAMEGQFRMMLTPWFRYLLSYDPRPILKQVRCPVLALTGERDLQVPPRQNLPAIAEALKAGGNRDFTTIELPELNHLLQTSRTGSPNEYAQIEETISPKALEIIANWIIKHTTASKSAPR